MRRGLSITPAARVDLLNRERRHDLIEHLQGVEEIKVIAETVKQFVAPGDTTPELLPRAMKSLARHLQAGMADIEGRANEVDPGLARQYHGLLRSASGIITKLLEKCA